MSKNKAIIEGLKYDKRLLNINIKNGTITQAEYDNVIDQLPDLESQAEPMTLSDTQSPNEPVAPPQAPAEAPQSSSYSDTANSGFSGGSYDGGATDTSPVANDPFKNDY